MNRCRLTCLTQVFLSEPSLAIKKAEETFCKDIRNSLLSQESGSRIVLEKDTTMDDEAYRLEVKNGNATLYYGGDLGGIYGLYFLSEVYLGVKPFDKWSGRQPPQKNEVIIPNGCYYSPKRAVKFRGWFVNDEVMLDGFPDTQAEKIAMWELIFETILRCGGNMVIPGTDRKDDGEQLCDLALDMGLWISQHHTELLGARMFARAYPGLTASYTCHSEKFETLWQEAIDHYAGKKVVWAVGYRGQGDTAFWTNETGFDSDEARGDMIAKVIHRQMELVRVKDLNAIFCTNLYGEMMDLYRAGCLCLPDEVIKIWGDNGYGKMVNRRTGNFNPRVVSMPINESGENGLYYHASFYDLQAANHTTMSPNSPYMLADELMQAIKNGANVYWNINVGSIVPHLYILDLIRVLWNEGKVDVEAHALQFAEDAKVADLLLSYSDYTPVYGENTDDRAGDQYEHFVLRHFVRAILRGETEKPLERLMWAASKESFLAQAVHIKGIVKQSLEGWANYVAQCKVVGNPFITLQGVLRQTGLTALYETCNGAIFLGEGKAVEAYLCTSRAINALREGIEAMEKSEHRKFYRNECFSNMRLSLHWLETLRSFIRIVYDGENAYDWDRFYLFPPEDRGVWCLTHRHNQLSDDRLSEMLIKRGVIDAKK